MRGAALYAVSLAVATTVLLFTTQLAAGGQARRGTPIVLDEESWVQLLEGEWLVDFYAPWCPACKKLEPEWRKLAEWSDDLNIKVASADVTLNPGISGRFMVSGLPTIYHVKDGIFRQYTGARDHNSFINFIEEQKWMHIEPVSKWRAPNTLQMTIVAYAFRISLALRDVHNYLVDHVGMPYYISYLIFALCTITLGTVLGLLIVFIIDQFCPPRAYESGQTPPVRPPRAVAEKTKKSDGDDDEEEDEEEDEDDKKPLRRRNKANN